MSISLPHDTHKQKLTLETIDQPNQTRNNFPIYRKFMYKRNDSSSISMRSYIVIMTRRKNEWQTKIKTNKNMWNKGQKPWTRTIERCTVGTTPGSGTKSKKTQKLRNEEINLILMGSTSLFHRAMKNGLCNRWTIAKSNSGKEWIKRLNNKWISRSIGITPKSI